MEDNRYTPHSFSKRFSPETLLRQFLICKRLDQIPNKWRQESIDEFYGANILQNNTIEEEGVGSNVLLEVAYANDNCSIFTGF